MIHRRFWNAIIIMALMPCALFAQTRQSDFGIWTNINLSKQISKKWDAGFEGEMRTCDNVSAVSRWSGALFTSYRLNKYLKVGGDYNLLYRHTLADEKFSTGFTDKGNYKETTKYYPSYWQTSHRFGAYLTGSYKVGHFVFSLRERIQYTLRTGDSLQYVKVKNVYDGTSASDGLKKSETSIDSKDISGEKCQLRSRFKVEYSRKKCAFVPYASAELYNNLTDGFSAEKYRLTIGSEYKIDKKNRLELYYRFQRDMDDDLNSNILGVGYSLKF